MEGLDSSLRVETYVWRFRNALVSLEIDGTPKDVVSLDIQSAIDGFNRGLAGAPNFFEHVHPTPKPRL